MEIDVDRGWGLKEEKEVLLSRKQKNQKLLLYDLKRSAPTNYSCFNYPP